MTGGRDSKEYGRLTPISGYVRPLFSRPLDLFRVPSFKILENNAGGSRRWRKGAGVGQRAQRRRDETAELLLSGMWCYFQRALLLNLCPCRCPRPLTQRPRPQIRCQHCAGFEFTSPTGSPHSRSWIRLCFKLGALGSFWRVHASPRALHTRPALAAVIHDE
jgi:hypothetical protein